MFNPAGFDQTLTQFHDSVEKLYQEQPKNIFTSTYQRVIAWIFGDDTNQRIINISNQAEKILHSLPETTLANKNFEQIEIDGTVVSKEDLSRFCNDMDRLFKEIYPHVRKNPFSSANKMPDLVQEFYSPKLKQLHAEKAENPALKLDEDHKTKRKIAKGKLAIALGRGVKKNTGSTGTLIILDVNGMPVGIHKVSKQNVSFKTRFQNFFKVFFRGQMSCLSNSDYAQPLAEKASYIVSKKMGFNLAPPSKKANLKGLKGVFQVFISKEKVQSISSAVKEAQCLVVKHAKTNPQVKGKGPEDYREVAGDDVLPLLEAREPDEKGNLFDETENILFQKLAIFDYLIGNLDRHEENWLVTLSSEGKITNIKAIDNANAFPKIQPEKGTRAAKYQYHWKSLKIADQVFEPEVVGFVRNTITLGKLREVIEEIREACGLDFLDGDMDQLLIRRQKVIYKLVCEDVGKKPRDLAALSTEAEMLTYSEKKISDEGERIKIKKLQDI